MNKKPFLISCLALASMTISIIGNTPKVSAHHDYAPVRPGDHQSMSWRERLNWQSNPDRPRRTFGRSSFPGGTYFGSSDVYETFVIPDQNPMSWEAASRLCDRDGGQLVWQRNRKVCLRTH